MSAHTPGPWKVDAPRDSKIGPGRWVRNGDDYVARVDMANEARGNANARLVSAAPVLLDAVELAIAAIENSAATDYGSAAALRDDERQQWAVAIETLRAARTKARGAK